MPNLRLDIGTLHPAVRLPNGLVKLDGFLTRTGVFTYLNPDGSIRREYRPSSEVFNKASLDSFALAPVTDDHPAEMITAQNAKSFAVGAVGDSVRKDGDHVRASLTVYSEDVIKKLDSGKVQLSCGYTCDLVMNPGVTEDGIPYDAIQTNIVGNHVAIVEQGRAGTARVRMDGAALIDEVKPNGAVKMDELKEQKERADKAEAEKSDLEKKLAQAENEACAQKARADKAEATLAETSKGFADAIRARVALEATAAKILGEDVSTLSDRDLKIAVVKKVDGTEIAVERSDDYVAARFDSCVERSTKSDAAVASLRTAVNDASNEGEDKEAKARAAQKARTANLYKGVK